MKEIIIEKFRNYVIDRKVLKNIKGGAYGCQWSAVPGGYPSSPSVIVYCAPGTSGCSIVAQGSLRCLSCGGSPPGACI